MENKGLFSFFQRLGKSLMLPVAVLPVAAILLRFGVLLKLDFITAAGAAIFDNLSIIFGIGVAIGLAFDGAGAAGLAGSVAYFVIVRGTQAINEDINMGVFSGIIGGIIAAALYNKFYNIKLPSWLGFFAGRRFVPIITGIVCIFVAFIMGYLWPILQSGLSNMSLWISGSGALGLFLYGTLNRLLIPFGLHHVLNSYFWFQHGEYNGAEGIVNGDLTRFFANDPSAGDFMTGFFPIMMFALPAAALAMYMLSKKTKKAQAAGVLFSIAFTAFLTGITEPIEFAFMFIAPALYVAHALLTGAALAVSSMLGMKLGFGFSAGLIDYIINMNLATKPLLLIPIGLAFGGLYFVVFSIVIKMWNLKTIGREDDESVSVVKSVSSMVERSRAFLAALGGVENLSMVDFCITRLRVVLVDPDKVNSDEIKELGAKGIIAPTKNNLQIVLGQEAEQIADAINTIRNKG